MKIHSQTSTVESLKIGNVWLFNPAFHNGCNCSFMMELKLNHVKKEPPLQIHHKDFTHHSHGYQLITFRVMSAIKYEFLRGVYVAFTNNLCEWRIFNIKAGQKTATVLQHGWTLIRWLIVIWIFQISFDKTIHSRFIAVIFHRRTNKGRPGAHTYSIQSVGNVWFLCLTCNITYRDLSLDQITWSWRWSGTQSCKVR